MLCVTIRTLRDNPKFADKRCVEFLSSENITDSSFVEDLNFMQERYEKELNEKGEVEFMVYTKTYISLKKA